MSCFAGNAGTLDDNYGRFIGSLKGLAHGVRGTVYAVDENTLYVRGFYYDGIGPSKYPHLIFVRHKCVSVTYLYNILHLLDAQSNCIVSII